MTKQITHAPQPALRRAAGTSEFARQELERRGAIPPGVAILTGHAVDRASQKFLPLWLQGRLQGEGIFHWLHRQAGDALAWGNSQATDEPGAFVRLHNGIRFVFREKTDPPILLTVTHPRETSDPSLDKVTRITND